MKNRIIIINILFLIFVSMGIAKDKKIIAVVKTSDNVSYELALKGFNKILKENKIKVYLRKFNYQDKNLIMRIRYLRPVMILTLGSAATKVIKENIKDIPIVFSMILDPKGIGARGKNLTGASLDIPMSTQLNTLKSVIPRVKKFGIIYHPEENKYNVNKANRVAKSMGLKLDTFPIKPAKEIPIVEKMKIDALLIIPDNIVCQPIVIKRILISSLKSNIPVMGISPSYTKAGAILSVSCDYEDIGYQTGEIATKIFSGEPPWRIPISVPQKITLSINLTVANRLGIKISNETIKKAKYVFGE